MKLWYKKTGWSSEKTRARLEAFKAESVKSIAVIRHAALGDMIHTRPFLLELKRAFPNASITISVNASYARGVPDDLVDRVHMIYRRKTKKQSILDQFKTIRSLGYHDLLFDLADSPRSRMIAALNPAKFKIGYTSHWLLRKIVYDVSIPRSDLVFEADMNLQLLNVLGIKTQYPPVYGLENGIRTKEKYVVYFPNASVPERYWDQASVSGLVRIMSDRYPDFTHYILKGITEGEKTDAILKELRDLENVAPIEKSSLEDTIDFIRDAGLVVANDTSIRHLAIATETPSLGIYFGKKLGSTPFRYWPRWGRHEAAFEMDGSQPSVEHVYECCCRLLDS